MSDLDKDFQKTVDQINAKLKEAAAALREANRLGDGAGLPGLIWTQWTSENMDLGEDEDELTDDERDEKIEDLQAKVELIDVSDFEHAMGQCGWSASASYC